MMDDPRALVHFMYGRGFWYADPLREIRGLSEKQLLWVPAPTGLCILWQVGHIAHRERLHVGRFLQGLEGGIIPAEYDVFGHRWYSVPEMRRSMGSVQGVLDWVGKVRERSHAYLDSLCSDDWDSVPPTPEDGLSVAHWLFITAAHTALHIGRIQMLRALIEGATERPC